LEYVASPELNEDRLQQIVKPLLNLALGYREGQPVVFEGVLKNYSHHITESDLAEIRMANMVYRRLEAFRWASSKARAQALAIIDRPLFFPEWWTVDFDVSLMGALYEYGTLQVSAWLVDVRYPFLRLIPAAHLEEFHSAAILEKAEGRTVRPTTPGVVWFIYRREVRMERAMALAAGIGAAQFLLPRVSPVPPPVSPAPSRVPPAPPSDSLELVVEGSLTVSLLGIEWTVLQSAAPFKELLNR
jgi:hypothetical protein